MVLSGTVRAEQKLCCWRCNTDVSHWWLDKGRHVCTRQWWIRKLKKKSHKAGGGAAFYLRKFSRSSRLQEDQDRSLGFLPFTHSPDIICECPLQEAWSSSWLIPMLRRRGRKDTTLREFDPQLSPWTGGISPSLWSQQSSNIRQHVRVNSSRIRPQI